MLKYIIKRIALMIPTFFLATFIVFVILSKVPGGPFEKAIMQLKVGKMMGGESGGGGGNGERSAELTPEQLDQIKKQYGLDKPLFVRYLIWLGFYPRDIKDKTIAYGEPFRENVRYIEVDKRKYELQRWVKVEKDASGKLVIYKSGLGSDFKFSENYEELPPASAITEWFPANEWTVNKADDAQVNLVQRKFSGIFTGDFGKSYKYDKPVLTLIRERLHISAYFGIIGFILTYLVCIPLGVMKAVRHGQNFDFATSTLIFLGYAIPDFALGVLLLTLFGGGSFWDVFPLGGFRSLDWDTLSTGGKILDQLHHTVLPVICWMVGSFATLTMLMKNSLMENLNLDYVRTAYAKGLPSNTVIYKHALRNSLIPIATGVGHIIGVFLAGSYLLEKVFNIDGLGMLGYRSIVETDYPIFLGFLVINMLVLMVGNIISDMLYAAIDPRIQFS